MSYISQCISKNRISGENYRGVMLIASSYITYPFGKLELLNTMYLYLYFLKIEKYIFMILKGVQVHMNILFFYSLIVLVGQG